MAISREMVVVLKGFLGRGPTRARTYIRDNLVVVVLQDTLTKAERALRDDGKPGMVREMRRALQDTIRARTTEVLEELTGRKVVAFLSDHDISSDVAAEVFLLEPFPEDAPGEEVGTEA